MQVPFRNENCGPWTSVQNVWKRSPCWAEEGSQGWRLEMKEEWKAMSHDFKVMARCSAPDVAERMALALVSSLPWVPILSSVGKNAALP